MAYYLVTAKPIQEKLKELKKNLEKNKYLHLKPFGEEVSKALTNAKWKDKNTAIWEEEDYCSPPLNAERNAVLDEYFTDIKVENVERNEGWQKIKNLPYIFENIKRVKI